MFYFNQKPQEVNAFRFKCLYNYFDTLSSNNLKKITNKKEVECFKFVLHETFIPLFPHKGPESDIPSNSKNNKCDYVDINFQQADLLKVRMQ